MAMIALGCWSNWPRSAAAGVNAFVACLLFACASHTTTDAGQSAQTALTEFRDAARIEIDDPVRAQEVSALIDQLRHEDRDARDVAEAYRQQLRAINANYDSSDEEISKLFAGYNVERIDRQRRVMNLWIEMAALMSDGEWNALKEKRVAAVKALVTTG